MENGGLPKVPDITLWSWMREVLGLVGTELILFSYIFSQSFDEVHKCITPLTIMEKWFGVTRQTLSKNIDSLVEKKYIVKQCNRDELKPILKRNCYYVDMNYIKALCKESNYSNYTNFMQSYKQALKEKYPDDADKIDEYVSKVFTYEKNKDVKVCLTLEELVKLLHEENDSVNSIDDMLSVIRKEKKPKRYAEKEYIQNQIDELQLNEPTVLIKPPKQKRVSKQARKAEWRVIKKEMADSFVLLNGQGNEDLKKLLYSFIETDSGDSYSPEQWEQQLDNLQRYGRTVDRMIEGVRYSYMNNYRTLYFRDKDEVDIDPKLKAISEYVHNNGEDNEELEKYLKLYVIETPKGKAFTLNQFMIKLQSLSDGCETLQQKIDSVKTCYERGYSSLFYGNTSFSTSTPNTQVSNQELDMDKKKELIEDFIKKGYYYLKPDIKKYLYMYVEETNVGRSMSAKDFELNLSNFRLFCLEDSKKIERLKAAIQNNYPKLAIEDFAETNRINKERRTREELATKNDNERIADIIKYKMMHPKDDSLKDVVLPKIG